MDKVFSIVTETSLSSYNFTDVNSFLEKHPDYYVKSVTPVRQPSPNSRGYYGVVIVLSNKGNYNLFSGAFLRNEQERGELPPS